MNYTFKIARRLARFRAAGILAACLFTLSCSADGPNGRDSSTDPTGVSISPDSVTLGINQTTQFEASMDTSASPLLSASKGEKSRGRKALVDLTITPQTYTMAKGSAASFTAVGTLRDGSTSAPSVTWSAAGGTIDSSGKYTAGPITGNYSVSAKALNGVADTAVVIVTETTPTVTSISLTPSSTSLPVGDSIQFTTVGKASDGATVPVSPKYAATGGTISSAGIYRAGTTPGTYSVIATDSVSGKADTSAVTITASSATLQAVELTPSTASLAAGATQQFTASGKMSDGSTSPITVAWSATGGTISSTGLYTAGQTAGTFRAIATQSGGALADTAAVTITTQVASAGCPASGYLRVVNVSTSAQLSTALAGAMPGDQIQLAPGNYNAASSFKLTRSGTAANRIVLCGPRTAIVNAWLDVVASYWHVRGFRIRGDTPLSKVWGVYQHAGGYNIYDGLEIDHQAQEGLMIHDGPSYDNVIVNNYIHDTGRASPQYGEGIYIGNGTTQDQIVDRTWIHHNTITNTGAEGIEIKSGTSGHIIEFNTITNTGLGGGVGSDVPIEIRGNRTQVRDNTINRAPRYAIETYVDRAGWGNNNVYQRNTASNIGNGRMFGFNAASGITLSGNVVYCDNRAVAPTVLNVTCTSR